MLLLDELLSACPRGLLRIDLEACGRKLDDDGHFSAN
jgi:hypothetical protein